MQDLACGVVDLLNADAVAAADKSIMGQACLAGESSSSSSSDDDSDSGGTSLDITSEGQAQGAVPAADATDEEMTDAGNTRGTAEEPIPVLQEVPGQPRRRVKAKRTSKIQELT
jgi:hypothetical protein